ncbi:hypothetical protein ABPG72_019165 [Tetrahymena utriculariae]
MIHSNKQSVQNNLNKDLNSNLCKLFLEYLIKKTKIKLKFMKISVNLIQKMQMKIANQKIILSLRESQHNFYNENIWTCTAQNQLIYINQIKVYKLFTLASYQQINQPIYIQISQNIQINTNLINFKNQQIKMSDTEGNAEIDLATVKKRKNIKNVDKQDDDAKKKEQMDTVKVGQNKKEMPKKKKSSSKESLVSSVSEQKNQQKKAAKNNNKKALKNLHEDKIDDENTDESDSEEQIAKEDISTCEQKPKGGKGGKKEPKANNKNKYSVQDFQTLIDYMKNSNKPFNATTLESNLKGKTQFKKGSIEAALAQGVEEKQIVKKAYGSAYVFWYNQELLPIVNKEEIEYLTNEILNKQKDASEVNQKLRNLISQLSKVMQEKTNDQLLIEIEKFKQQIFQLDQDMQYFTSESFVPEDSNIVRQIEDKLAKIEGIYKKRKRTCEEAVKDLLENQEESISLQQMFQTIGIDEADNQTFI